MSERNSNGSNGVKDEEALPVDYRERAISLMKRADSHSHISGSEEDDISDQNEDAASGLSFLTAPEHGIDFTEVVDLASRQYALDVLQKVDKRDSSGSTISAVSGTGENGEVATARQSLPSEAGKTIGTVEITDATVATKVVSTFKDETPDEGSVRAAKTVGRISTKLKDGNSSSFSKYRRSGSSASFGSSSNVSYSTSNSFLSYVGTIDGFEDLDDSDDSEDEVILLGHLMNRVNVSANNETGETSVGGREGELAENEGGERRKSSPGINELLQNARTELTGKSPAATNRIISDTLVSTFKEETPDEGPISSGVGGAMRAARNVVGTISTKIHDGKKNNKSKYRRINSNNSYSSNISSNSLVSYVGTIGEDEKSDDSAASDKAVPISQRIKQAMKPKSKKKKNKNSNKPKSTASVTSSVLSVDPPGFHQEEYEILRKLKPEIMELASLSGKEVPGILKDKHKSVKFEPWEMEDCNSSVGSTSKGSLWFNLLKMRTLIIVGKIRRSRRLQIVLLGIAILLSLICYFVEQKMHIVSRMKWNMDHWAKETFPGRCVSDGGSSDYESTDNDIDYPADYPYTPSHIPVNFDFNTFQPEGGNRYAEYKSGDSPYHWDSIDAIPPSILEQSDNVSRRRREYVAESMEFLWDNYRKNAFGKDGFRPVSGKGVDDYGGIATILIDSLDTLWLMDLKEEFYEGRDWIRDNLSYDRVKDIPISHYETTVRCLGGLLAAYDLSGDSVFLEKAEGLGSRLVYAFDTPSGLPRDGIYLNGADEGATGRLGHMFHHNSKNFDGVYSLSEVGSVQLEYRYLANATGNQDYAEISEEVFDILEKIMPGDDLLPFELVENPNGNVNFNDRRISFGRQGGSAYENALKIWIQGGRKAHSCREMWDNAMDAMHAHLLRKSSIDGLTYIAERNDDGTLNHRMEHSTCFMGGALALGAYTDLHGITFPRALRDLTTARALTYTCYQMYARSKTGLAPEFVRFGGCEDMSIPVENPSYTLRPELAESLYYLNKLTGDPIYREWGWEIFQSIQKYCKTTYGYGSLKNVDIPSLKPEDEMESYFLAQTLKYLYLLFDPDSKIELPIKHVFTTEAHPLRSWK